MGCEVVCRVDKTGAEAFLLSWFSSWAQMHLMLQLCGKYGLIETLRQNVWEQLTEDLFPHLKRSAQLYYGHMVERMSSETTFNAIYPEFYFFFLCCFLPCHQMHTNQRHTSAELGGIQKRKGTTGRLKTSPLILNNCTYCLGA